MFAMEQLVNTHCCFYCCHGTQISIFGTDTSENPRFSVPISGTKAKQKNMLIKKHTIFINKVKQK